MRALLVVLCAAALAAPLRDGGAARDSSGGPRLRRVTIAHFAYRPAALTVALGDTVAWTNLDLVAHSVTSTGGRELASPDLAPREHFRHVAEARGTFRYHCELHPTMKGTLVVK